MTIKKLQNMKNKVWMLEEREPILKKIWMTCFLEEDQDLLEDSQRKKAVNPLNKQSHQPNQYNRLKSHQSKILINQFNNQK
jgi:hypothetical protein